MKTMLEFKEGSTVVLFGCDAWISEGNEQSIVTGLYVIEEFVPCEPSAYQWEAGCHLYELGGEDHDAYIFVSADKLLEQLYPDSHARQLVQEREMDFHEERN